MSRPVSDDDPFVGIAHPVRRKVLDLLRNGPMPSGELQGHFRMSWPNLSHHLGVLRNAGLVTQRRVGRQRMYRIEAKGLRSVGSWLRVHEKTGRSQRT